MLRIDLLCVCVCGALHAWNDSRVTASHTYVYCEKQVWMRRGCFAFRLTRSHLGGVECIVATYCTQTSETTRLWISYLCSVVCRCVFSVCLKVVASFVIWLWMEYSHKWSLQLPFIHPQMHFNPLWTRDSSSEQIIYVRYKSGVSACQGACVFTPGAGGNEGSKWS